MESVTKTRTRTALLKMLSMVKEGRWCRDRIHKESRLGGQYCALGLAGMGWDDRPYGYRDANPVLDALEAAIERVPDLKVGAKMNGGTMRNPSTRNGRIASYNNTVEDDTVIVDWIERALELV